MSTAIQVMQLMFYVVGILFMITFMIVGIWSFVIFVKSSKNQRIQNYLLQKINDSISALELKVNRQDSSESLNNDEEIIQDSFFDDNSENDLGNDSIYKIK